MFSNIRKISFYNKYYIFEYKIYLYYTIYFDNILKKNMKLYSDKYHDILVYHWIIYTETTHILNSKNAHIYILLKPRRIQNL